MKIRETTVFGIRCITTVDPYVEQEAAQEALIAYAEDNGLVHGDVLTVNGTIYLQVWA